MELLPESVVRGVVRTYSHFGLHIENNYVHFTTRMTVCSYWSLLISIFTVIADLIDVIDSNVDSLSVRQFSGG